MKLFSKESTCRLAPEKKGKRRVVATNYNNN
jgi:hypothetical protein